MSDENDESTESKASTAEFDSRLQDAIKEARQARHDLKSVCDEILNVLRKKARDQMWHPKGLSVDDSVVDVAVPRLQQTIDPYGAGGFTCEACLKEMPNMYVVDTREIVRLIFSATHSIEFLSNKIITRKSTQVLSLRGM